jgi:hypothetical protein
MESSVEEPTDDGIVFDGRMGVSTGEVKIKMKFDSLSGVRDEKIKTILNRDIQEFGKCIHNETPKSALLMAGSIIEAVLYVILNHHKELAIEGYIDHYSGKNAEKIDNWKPERIVKIADKLGLISSKQKREMQDILKTHEMDAIECYKQSVNKEIDQWNLGQMITVTRNLKLIEGPFIVLAEFLKDYRNLIHPLYEIRNSKSNTHLDDVSIIAVSVLNILSKELNELTASPSIPSISDDDRESLEKS